MPYWRYREKRLPALVRYLPLRSVPIQLMKTFKSHDERVTVPLPVALPPDVPLAAVAAECGFGNVSHFGQTFRRFTGASPAGFRARSAALSPAPMSRTSGAMC